MTTIASGTSLTITSPAKGALYRLTSYGAVGKVTGAQTMEIGPAQTTYYVGPLDVGQSVTITSRAGEIGVNYGYRDITDIGPSGLVHAQTDASGAVSLVSGDGKALPDYDPPRLIKRFRDLIGVTVTATNATVVSSIDPNSPFGCPALRCEGTWTTTGGRVEITPPAPNIPNFDGHLGYSVWGDDATKIGTAAVFIGTDTGYATAAMQADSKVFVSTDESHSGPRIVYAGPMKLASSATPPVNTFTFGTDTLAATKLRVTASNPLVSGEKFLFWVLDCWIAKPQRPICVFSFDDGYDAWTTVVAPALAKYGYKGTFGIDAETIDGAGGITSANLAALIGQGHHFSSHNQFNYRLQILCGNGTGKVNGSNSSAQATSAYATAYADARRTYEALGIDPDDFMFHPWVQGGPDFSGMDALIAQGVELARGTSPYEPQLYGAPALYLNAMNLRSIALSSAYSLEANKVKVLSAYQNGGIAFIMGHDFGDTSGSVKWVSADFVALVDYVASLGFEVLTARQLRDRLDAQGLLMDRNHPLLSGSQQPVRCIGRLIGANMNSTADQTITLLGGSWKIEGVYFTTPSTTLLGSPAAGGVYTATAKGGQVVVPAAQGYVALTAATDVVGAVMNPAVGLTLSATAGGAVTVTASGSAFTANDVGRTITSGSGVGVITGYTSATVVTMATSAAFPSTSLSSAAWSLGRAVASGSVYLSLTTGHGSAATADVFVFGRPA